MSYRIEASVTINAPREYVWEVVQNAERRIEWDERVVRVRHLTPGPVAKGTQLEIVMRMYGLDFPATLEYVTWTPCSRSGMKSVKIGGGVSNTVGSWNFEQNADGSTTWTTTILVTEVPGIFGRLMKRTLVRTFEQLTHKSQANLKRLIEAEYRPVPRVETKNGFVAAIL